MTNSNFDMNHEKAEKEKIIKSITKAIGDGDKEWPSDMLSILKRVVGKTRDGNEILKRIETYENRQVTDNKEMKSLLHDVTKVIRDNKIVLPDEYAVWVKNQIDIPDEVKISNADEIGKGIKIPKIPKYPSEIKIKESKWINEQVVTVIKGFVMATKQLAGRILRTEIVNNKSPEKAIAVRLVSKDGRKFVSPDQTTIIGNAGSGYSPFKNPDGTNVDANTTANGDLVVAVESISNITTIGDGRKEVAIAGTREPLVAASTPCKRVDIVAETNNTGIIVVGGITVVAAEAARQGVPLNTGDAYSFEIDDLHDIYLDTTVNTDGVSFVYFD